MFGDSLIDWFIDWLNNHKNDWSIQWMIRWILIQWIVDVFKKWLIDRLINWLIDWLTDWLTNWLIDWLKKPFTRIFPQLHMWKNPKSGTSNLLVLIEKSIIFCKLKITYPLFPARHCIEGGSVYCRKHANTCLSTCSNDRKVVKINEWTNEL